MTTAPIAYSSPSAAGQVTTLHGEAELVARAAHLFAARTEFICAATDMSIWAVISTRAAARGQVERQHEAGVEIYKLYTAEALATPEDVEHIKEIAAHGARIRICAGELPHETIIIDRRIAIVAGPLAAGGRDFNVITVPDVVAGLRSLVLTAWQAGTELADALPSPPPRLDEQGVVILRALSAGQKDETAARALGLSVRTYRRRVAELMELLGASSRFQAGVRARELGLRV